MHNLLQTKSNLLFGRGFELQAQNKIASKYSKHNPVSGKMEGLKITRPTLQTMLLHSL